MRVELYGCRQGIYFLNPSNKSFTHTTQSDDTLYIVQIYSYTSNRYPIFVNERVKIFYIFDTKGVHHSGLAFYIVPCPD